MKNNPLKRPRDSPEEDRISKRARKQTRVKDVSIPREENEYDSAYWDPESVALSSQPSQSFHTKKSNRKEGSTVAAALHPSTPKRQYHKTPSKSSSKHPSNTQSKEQVKSTRPVNTPKDIQLPVHHQLSISSKKTPGSGRSLRSQGPPPDTEIKKSSKRVHSSKKRVGHNRVGSEKKAETIKKVSQRKKTTTENAKLSSSKSPTEFESPEEETLQAEKSDSSITEQPGRKKYGRKPSAKTKSIASSPVRSRAKTLPRRKPVKSNSQVKDGESSDQEPLNLGNAKHVVITNPPSSTFRKGLLSLKKPDNDDFEADGELEETGSSGQKPRRSVPSKSESIISSSPVKFGKRYSIPKDEVEEVSQTDSDKSNPLDECELNELSVNIDPSANPFHETDEEEEPQTSDGIDEQGKEMGNVSQMSLATDGILPEEFFTRIQNHILGKLMGRIPIPLIGQDGYYKKIYDLLQQTVVSGESNSCIIHGPRSVGKSSIVNAAIRNLRTAYHDAFMVVRLSGYAQTDDRLALKEIARQLANEMDIESQSKELKSYSDMLTALLGTLSHPDELGITQDDEETIGRATISSSVIFILDEFDQFVHHPRQTLLYNLFDIAQNKKAPIAVLGLTCRYDIADSLEKRVKSRFSHRSYQISLPESFGTFEEICKASLFISFEESGDFDQNVLTGEEVGILQQWNHHIDLLFLNLGFRDMVEQIFCESKDVRAFHLTCLLPIKRLTTVESIPSAQSFRGNALVLPTSRSYLLKGLTLLELALLISAAQVDARDSETVNFNMAYEEYRVILKKAEVSAASAGSTASSGAIRIVDRVTAMNSWDILGRKGLMVTASGGAFGGGLARECRMWCLEVGLGELQGFVEESSSKLPSIVKRWVKS
ncbi:Origin recognition complex subunit 4 [Neolecta irregularis DAH-3]|uniref:Origin recognition complex subunit 4 n=1 Tax=Neolecta irregularis (strain DAH-3) TaxID=1198029 RepID=A0A1U7LVL5_NEOID|nr:Origin recognition complex subunit 4 [Neolecta irregularis DAH-3]|eukprot:OLL26684.1 Origin recognition complex subunit 4 [Neolecta irregularis DAH-3]